MIFGVNKRCGTHEEAALLGASNLVDAYIAYTEQSGGEE